MIFDSLAAVDPKQCLACFDLWIRRDFVQRLFESLSWIRNALFQCLHHAHQYFTSFCPFFGLRAVTHFPCDHRRPQLTLGSIVLTRYSSIFYPMIKMLGFFDEKVLP